MFRILFIIFASLLVYIPHTSVQDGSLPRDNNHRSRRSTTSTNMGPLESLIMTLTEQQYQYETAYYALALKNVFPNLAKLLHERSEQKYHDIKGLVRLGQILNLPINLRDISSSKVKRPLDLLSPTHINKTNLVQFFSELESEECNAIFNHLSKVYEVAIDMSIPLQMYLKEKLFMKQIITCKRTADLHVQFDRFVERNSNDVAIPFSFMYFDSRAQKMLAE